MNRNRNSSSTTTPQIPSCSPSSPPGVTFGATNQPPTSTLINKSILSHNSVSDPDNKTVIGTSKPTTSTAIPGGKSSKTGNAAIQSASVKVSSLSMKASAPAIVSAAPPKINNLNEGPNKCLNVKSSSTTLASTVKASPRQLAPPPPFTVNKTNCSFSKNTEALGSITTSSTAAEGIQLAVNQLENALQLKDPNMQLDAAKKIRKLLLVDHGSLVKDVLHKLNIVSPLLTCLKNEQNNPDLQVEALWALTNIAAGTTEHTQLLIESNAVPVLVSLLHSDGQGCVLEQAIWVLGNIAGDGHVARDTVIKAGVFFPLMKCIHSDITNISLLRISTWTLSNLCDGPFKPLFCVDSLLKSLNLILQIDDTEVLSHACWALSHLCDGPSPHLKSVVNTPNVCKRLVSLLSHKSWRLVKPALRTIGNIVCAEDEQDYTQYVIQCDAVPLLRQLIDHSNREIQKESCWTLSNIAAGTVPQIQAVLDSGGMPSIMKLAQRVKNETDPDVKVEACWVLLNATSCGSQSQIEHLVQIGCVNVMCNLLQDSGMVLMAIEGLEKILKVGDTLAIASNPNKAGEKNEGNPNQYAKLVDALKVKALQSHPTKVIAERATKIWKTYFEMCALCKNPYVKNIPSSGFCEECQCYVCNACDCTRFHLSYQEKLWEILESNEVAKGKKKKKKKGAKKKMKEKLKREEEDLCGSEILSKNTAKINLVNEGEDKEEDFKTEDLYGPRISASNPCQSSNISSIASMSFSKDQPSSTSAFNKSALIHHENENGKQQKQKRKLDNKQNNQSLSSSNSNLENVHNRNVKSIHGNSNTVSNQTRQRILPIQNQDHMDIQTGSNLQEDVATSYTTPTRHSSIVPLPAREQHISPNGNQTEVNEQKNGQQSSRALSKETENDEYVDFLMETGSILELARKMGLEDDQSVLHVGS